jgi:hypothetical protein
MFSGLFKSTEGVCVSASALQNRQTVKVMSKGQQKQGKSSS